MHAGNWSTETVWIIFNQCEIPHMRCVIADRLRNLHYQYLYCSLHLVWLCGEWYITYNKQFWHIRNLNKQLNNRMLYWNFQNKNKYLLWAFPKSLNRNTYYSSNDWRFFEPAKWHLAVIQYLLLQIPITSLSSYVNIFI